MIGLLIRRRNKRSGWDGRSCTGHSSASKSSLSLEFELAIDTVSEIGYSVLIPYAWCMMPVIDVSKSRVNHSLSPLPPRRLRSSSPSNHLSYKSLPNLDFGRTSLSDIGLDRGPEWIFE